MAKVTVDGCEIEVEDGTTVLQACEVAGIEIPRFCYHERLSIAGNCRMCLVEIEKMPKLAASCAMPVNEGMIIHTNTPKVQKARGDVVELLLVNHPLDCPICDQGGECDLQDQAFKYGSGQYKFHEEKRSVHDKYMGPFISTHMNRCIHCTRCIRFSTEIAGVDAIAGINRGEHNEITTYLGKAVRTELSGNLVDVCPVGAITSKPYAYKTRSWELHKTESIDVFDAMGANIRIDTRNLEVMRILPRNNDDINEEWISDKSRYAYDAFRLQRIDKPYIRIDCKLAEATWEDALALLAEKLKKCTANEIAAIAGDMADMESMFALKYMLNILECKNHDANQSDHYIDYSSRGNYLFNTGFANISKCDGILIIGADLKRNSPVLNARIRRSVRNGTTKLFRIGEYENYGYKIQELGTDINVLDQIIASDDLDLAKFERFSIIIGDAALTRKDAPTILYKLQQIANKYDFGIDKSTKSQIDGVEQQPTAWHWYNVLHNTASAVGALDLGFSPASGGLTSKQIIEAAHKGDIKFLYLLDADEIDLGKISKKCCIVYHGHHGDYAANKADIILPSTIYTEKTALYMNMEGRLQSTAKASEPIGGAKEDWEILFAIIKAIGISTEFDDLSSLRAELYKTLPTGALFDIPTPDKVSYRSSFIETKDTQIKYIKSNFYMTDAISRASRNMSNCLKEIGKIS